MLTRNTLTDPAWSPPPREPPHNIEAEQALLGAILMNATALDRVQDFLRPEHFYDPFHAQIYDVIQKTVQSGRTADPVTLKTYFENFEPITPELTADQYLGRLFTAATTIVNAAAYGRTVYDLAIRRGIVSLGEDMVNSAYDAPIDFPPESMIVEAETRLYSLAQDGSEDRVSSFAVALTEALEAVNTAYQRDGGLAGLSTGLRDLDNKMGGLVDSDLVIVAGRPSMGKTALATGIAWHVATQRRCNSDGEPLAVPVLFFSLEMSRSQLAARILAAASEISSEKSRRGMISEDEFRKLALVSQKISEAPLTIDHRGGLTIDQLRNRARRLQRQTGAKLVVVDYLQLMAGIRYAGKNRVQEVTEITTGLKAMAKELEVPVIALSQLSRDLEKREDKRPMLSDLRDSGSIEQDADVVLFCYRDEYYVERRKPPDHDLEKFSSWEAEMRNAHGKAEIIIGKNRHGPIGTVEVAFEAPLTRFSDLAPQYQLPERFQ